MRQKVQISGAEVWAPVVPDSISGFNDGGGESSVWTYPDADSNLGSSRSALNTELALGICDYITQNDLSTLNVADFPEQSRMFDEIRAGAKVALNSPAYKYDYSMQDRFAEVMDWVRPVETAGTKYVDVMLRLAEEDKVEEVEEVTSIPDNLMRNYDLIETKGACAEGIPTSAMFPSENSQNRDIGKICLDCPEVAECYEAALLTPQDYGLWGGTRERERRSFISLFGKTNGLTDSKTFQPVRRWLASRDFDDPVRVEFRAGLQDIHEFKKANPFLRENGKGCPTEIRAQAIRTLEQKQANLGKLIFEQYKLR